MSPASTSFHAIDVKDGVPAYCQCEYEEDRKKEGVEMRYLFSKSLNGIGIHSLIISASLPVFHGLLYSCDAQYKNQREQGRVGVDRGQRGHQLYQRDQQEIGIGNYMSVALVIVVVW